MFWHAVGLATTTLPTAVATAVAAVLLWVKGYRRAATWTVGVMTTIGLLTWAIKQGIGRARPVWDDPIQVLTSYSFPSGHSSGIAGSMGVAVVLTSLLVRRRSVRRVVAVVAIAVVLLVGADRIFLGSTTSPTWSRATCSASR